MTSHYQPKRFKRWRIAAAGLRTLATLLRAWPLLLLAFFLVSPITPHVLWEYTYTPAGSHRIYQRCHYFGVRGMVRYRRGFDCPFIAMIDHRKLDD